MNDSTELSRLTSLAAAAALLLMAGCSKTEDVPPPAPKPAAAAPKPSAPAKAVAPPAPVAEAPAAPASAPDSRTTTALDSRTTTANKMTPRKVEVKGEPGKFQLLVDGKPYFIKGVGFNVDTLEYAEPELKVAKQMGFNSLRFWGQGQVNLAGLDLAEKYGMTTVPSWWLSHDNPKRSPTARDYANAKENAAEIEDIVEWVNGIKDHPAVLMWGIGNEAYHFGGQGEAYCRHLENIAQAIHKADPNHPVMTVDVNVSPVWDLAKFCPSIDIYGCNTYSGWTAAKSSPIEVAKIYKKPTVFTEFGPGLPSGIITKLNYKLHAQSWVDSWKKGILAARNNCLGGYFFVFHDGRPDDIYFGLVDYKNRPKPVITQAIKNALATTDDGGAVKVAVKGDGFELQVGGDPYFIKGVNMEPAELTPAALELAARIGLNTLRLPIAALDKPEFAFLPGYGLKALVRIDLEPEHRVKKPAPGSDKMEWEASGRDYSNAEQNKAAIQAIVQQVEKYKATAGILMWEIGNETYSHSTHREEFARFLNEVCKAVHAADPNHPIVYTTSFDAGIRDFAQFTPDLDVLGSNSYVGPGILNSMAARTKQKMNKPVLFMVSAFLDEGSGRSNLTEEVKIWMDVEMWKRGVLRSRPVTLGGFFRGWQDKEYKDMFGKDHKDLWGFVRKDGTPKETNILAVQEVLLSD